MNLFTRKLLQYLPDKLFIKIKFYHHFKRVPNLKNPQTYNEKLQWLKLNDRRPEYTKMVDKFEAKKLVSSIIGDEYVIPSYGVWDSFDDIDFKNLPNKFVLKTTHDCGGVVICKDKNSFDKVKAKEFLEKHMKYNYFYEGREWPYKDVKPRILAEPYMENIDTGDLKDYKVFAFNGVAKALYIASDRQSNNEETKFDFFDMNYNKLDIRNGHPNSKYDYDKPIFLSEMKLISEKISKGYPHIRVDFYEVNGKLYVGELTLFHMSGFAPFEPNSWDYEFGRWIALPK